MNIHILAIILLVYLNAIIIWNEVHCVFVSVKTNTEYISTQDQTLI